MTTAHRPDVNIASPNDGGPAANGGPDLVTCADPFHPTDQVEGWDKVALVELRGFEPLAPSMRTEHSGDHLCWSAESPQVTRR